MKSIEVTCTDGRRYSYRGAQHWDELKNAKQYLQLFRLSVVGLHVPFARFIALRLIYGMPERISKIFFNNTNEEIVSGTLTAQERHLLLGQQLIDTIQWIYTDLPSRTWYFQKLRILWKTFEGPGNGFATITFRQFMFAERYFQSTGQQGPAYKQELRLMMAWLYRPKGQAFDPKTVERRARWFRLVKPDKIQAMRYNYHGLRHRLTVLFPEVFEPSTKKAKISPTATGWLDVALSLAGDDIRKLHDYEDADLFLMMKVLQNACKRSKEMQEIANKNK